RLRRRHRARPRTTAARRARVPRRVGRRRPRYGGLPDPSPGPRGGRRRAPRRRRAAGGMIVGEPLVTVVVPAYGDDPWLERCVHAALASTGADVDVVVVDNGAT